MDGKCSYTVESLPSFSGWDLWRPYICDIPKAEKVSYPSAPEMEWEEFPCYRLVRGDILPGNKDGDVVVESVMPESSTVTIKYTSYHLAGVMCTPKHTMLWRKKKEIVAPTPDANGWWRIEDRKPDLSQNINAKFAHGVIEPVQIHSLDRDKFYGIGNIEPIPIHNITHWCPLDMTGPEKK